jgi:putative ABC transport system substrate-binding protein
MAIHIRRREFIFTLGGGAAAWPLAARAQEAKRPVRIGLLPLGSPSNAYDRSLVEAFQQGLQKVGLVENRDIVLDIVWTSGDPDQAVTELMQRGAQMLVPCGSSASVAAKRHAGTIPIVFMKRRQPHRHGTRREPSAPRLERDRIQRHPYGPKRQVGGPRPRTEQAASDR